MIHLADLARLYVAAIEGGENGQDYHGVAECGINVGEIASVISNRYGAPSPETVPVETVINDLGSLAACYAFDQTMDAPYTRSALNWTPKHIGILQTILKMKTARDGG